MTVAQCKACNRPEENIPLRGRYAWLCSDCRQTKARAEVVGDMPPGPERGKAILKPVLDAADAEPILQTMIRGSIVDARERAAAEPMAAGTYEECALVLVDAARDLDAARERYNAALRSCSGRKAAS